MLRLGVNIDHVATLREARGTAYPDPLEAAETCRRAGADGITVHLREDRRHIQERDVRALRAWGGLPLNLEMADAPDVLRIALEIRPDEVCLVPERREERTTEGGLDAAGRGPRLRSCLDALRDAGIRASLFIEPDERQVDAARELGVPMVELHTGTYATGGAKAGAELARLAEAARRAQAGGLQVNAGHGLNPGNLPGLFAVPHLHTLNIGHSLVARSVFLGLDAAVREMRLAMSGYPGGGA